MMVLRQLLAVALLPFTVIVLVPVWIARRYGVPFSVARSTGALSLQLSGALVLCAGAALFAGSLGRFVAEGDGTLAPWDPPRRLVVRGPYRYVRNPMISGVIFVLIGEALLLRSPSHGVWAAAFLALNLVYIPLLEEPMLEARFGDDYRRYAEHVPRVWPRLRPWSPPEPPPAARRT